MAIYKSSDIKDTRVLLSQTPPNYVMDNYYLKELQQKVDADWRFRPNRFDIEKEFVMGTEIYEPIQVVLQSVKSDKGEEVSDDWVRVVYRNIQEPTRVGERFRFSHNFNPNDPSEHKSIWIALNYNNVQQTASQVCCRCNGTIIGIYTDENGVSYYHEEPVIQGNKLTTTTFSFNEVAVDPKGQLTIIAQHNKYTRQWYINQRFVIGYDTVYKVANIIKCDTETTYDPYDAGIIRVYLDIDQISEYDDFNKRIAFNGKIDQPIDDIDTAKTDKKQYVIKILDENGNQINVPQNLIDVFKFKPTLFIDNVASADVVAVDFTLTGRYADVAQLSDFVNISNENGVYTLRKIASDPGLSLHINCHTEDASVEFDIKLNGWN